MNNMIQKLKKIPKWLKISLISIIFISIAVHLCLPPVLKHYLNKGLQNIEGHSGYIEDVDVYLIRGAYSIQGLHLYSEELGGEYPLALIDEIDISIQWIALLSGNLVAQIEFINPELNFVIASENSYSRVSVESAEVIDAASDKLEGVENENRRERILERKARKINREKKRENLRNLPDIDRTKNNFDKIQMTVFRDFLLDQIPLNVNRVEIKNGSINYIDRTSDENVDIRTSEIDFQLNNLTNSKALSESLIADFEGKAIMMNSGEFSIKGALDPYDKDVTIDMDIEMNNFDLKELNNMFMSYANFDVDKGKMSVYAEISTKQGELDGYIKPFIEDLSILNYEEDKHRSAINLVWQTVLGGSSKLTRNLAHNELATKIPLKGNVTEPDFKLFNTVGNLFLHAIFYSIKPKVDANFKLAT